MAIFPCFLPRAARWFDTPEAFRPERFLTVDESRPKHAYLPFGGGPRLCIGNAFALMEMELILTMVLQSTTLAVVPGFQLSLEPSITLRPRKGLPVARSRRARPESERE